MRELKHKYIPGNPWMICDECGLRYRKSETLIRWDHAVVCQKCWEPKHPQESVRAKADKIRVNNPRPDTDGNVNLLIGVAPTVVGAGWTDNGDDTYTCSAINTVSLLMWVGLATVGTNYELSVFSTDITTGGISAAVGGVGSTDSLRHPGIESTDGTASSADLVVTASKLKGTFYFSLSEKETTVTQDDL